MYLFYFIFILFYFILSSCWCARWRSG